MSKYIFHILLIAIISIGFNSCKKANTTSVNVKHFEILCEQSDLDSIYNNHKKEIYIPIKFVSSNDTLKAKMRLRGDSSKKYDKKSLKIVFKKNKSPKGEKRKINLNSEWTDKTYLRQFLSTRLMQKAGVICFNSNFVRLKLNGEFWGIYLQVENIDKQFLVRNNLDKKGNLYKATKDGACLSHFDDIYVKWEKKTNKKGNWNDLQILINQLDTIDVKNYKTFLQTTFEYDKLLSIIAMNMLLQNGSTYYHNYYMYHDINGSGKWQMFPWDMDKALSYYNWKPYKFHETSSDWESDNPLIEKVFLSKEVMKDLKKKITQLDKTTYNSRQIDPLIDACKLALKPLVPNDDSDQINKKSDWLKALKNEKKFVSKQVDQILNQFKKLPSTFELEQVKTPHERNLSLKWHKSESTKPIKYKLLYGPDFLLKKESTKTIENISDTICQLSNLKPGKYYWRVYAWDGENLVEGYNTKSTFEILSERNVHIKKDTILFKKNSPHRINNSWHVASGASLIIEPGCKLLFSENARIINKGNIQAIGTTKDSIYFIPQDKIWDDIYSYNENSLLEFEFCHFQDGYFRSKNSDVNFKNCSYLLKNKKLWINGKRTALMWIHKGRININNCYFENIEVSEGEGLNINYADAVVKNSQFKQLSDAIEYMDVTKGEITGNIIINSPDDAIDLNGCSNIIIQDNLIFNNKDKAISIGTEEYGPSTNITIKNNLLVNNYYGLSIKDSSFCTIDNTSFINNNIGIEGRLKNNYGNYTLGGNANADNCLFYKNKKNVQADEASNITVVNSISKNNLIEGENNKKTNITFKDNVKCNYNTTDNKGSSISVSNIELLNNLIQD